MPSKRVSPTVLLFVSRVATLFSKVTGRPPFLKPDMVRRLQKDFIYNSRKAEKELGLSLRPLDETVADTVRWFLSHEPKSVTP
jgi:nucleoside-diphosphate-sugar epimerase